MTTHYCYTESPLGRILLIGDFQGLSRLNIQEGPAPLLPETHWRKDGAFFMTAIIQLNEYFAGDRQQFNLRLNPEGSEFQRQILSSVARIPYGETASYSDIARAVGKPKAVRSIASAMKNNTLPIILPCHRVVSRSGKQSEYNGGLKAREWLMDLELGKHRAAQEEQRLAETAQNDTEQALNQKASATKTTKAKRGRAKAATA